LAAIRGKEDLRSVINFDRFKSYDSLVDMGYKKLVRVDHSANEFSSASFVAITSTANCLILGFWGAPKHDWRNSEE